MKTTSACSVASEPSPVAGLCCDGSELRFTAIGLEGRGDDVHCVFLCVCYIALLPVVFVSVQHPNLL